MKLTRIISSSILFLTYVGWGAAGEWEGIPGCPSIVDLNNGLVSPREDTNTFPTCYCDNATADTSAETGGVEISCILFGRLPDMTQAIRDVLAANRSVWNIHTNGFIFENRFAIPANYFKEIGVKPRRLSFHGCSPADEEEVMLEFPPDALRGLEESLKHWDMNDCPLKDIPPGIGSLKALEILDLRSTLPEGLNISADAFKGLENLKTLDLSENSIEKWEKGLFQPLVSLEELLIGPRNKFDPILFSELNQLPSLKNLKMDTMGLVNISGTSFYNMSRLETLSLVSNDLKTIPQDGFKGLTNLKYLDLRINLIQDITRGAFEPLTSLKELQLAGTYFQDLEPYHFRGMSKLEELDLSFCEILAVPNDTFYGLDSLKYLNLMGNARLDRLYGGAFNGLDQLERLNLSDTAVTALSENVLTTLPNLTALSLTGSQLAFIHKFAFRENQELEDLYLDRTRLRWLPDTVFAPLAQSLNNVNVSGNPWVCDERMKKLRNNIRAVVGQRLKARRPLNILSAERLFCNEPPELEGQPLMVVPDRALRPYDPDLWTTAAPTPSPTPAISTPPPTLPPTTPPPRTPKAMDEPKTTDPPRTEPAPGSAQEVEPEQAEGGAGPSRATLGIAVAVIILAIIVIAAIIVGVIIMRKKRNRGISDTVMTFKRGKGSGEEDVVRNGKMKVRPQPDGVSATETQVIAEEEHKKEKEHSQNISNGHSDANKER